MNIFKKPASKEKEQLPQNNKPAEKQSMTEEKKDPHENGGCCGSCGGQQGKGL